MQSPGGEWIIAVQQHCARRDTAPDLAVLHALSETLETLSMLGTLLGWLAEHLREVTVQNDPDERRTALDILPRNLDVLQRGVTGRNVAAALRHVLEQTGIVTQSEAADSTRP
jgi:hypothetical protein